MRHTFRKEERLTGKKIISELMSKGKSFQIFPLRVVHLEINLPAKFPVQVVFSVPKKNFKSAVQRNRIKRRMREAYRKNKHLLYEALKKQMALLFIYNSKEESEYELIEAKIILSLHRLATLVNQ